MAKLYAYISHKNGVADDTALELLTAAAKIDAGAPVTAIVTGSGADLDKVCQEMAASYKEVLKIDNEAMTYPNSEIIRKALVEIIKDDDIVLLPHDTFGMDLGPGLSIKTDSPFAADIVDIEGVDGSTLKLIRQEFAGQVYTHVTCDISSGAILNIRPGVCKADESKAAGGSVTETSVSADLSAGRRYLETVIPEAGDVDITKSDVLVSVGRGIEDEENIEIAQELADAMGAVVSCSRPIVDAKWLEQSRQVGTSGKTVKPKVYMAMGISGSFQHLGGIKGGFMIAVNKNPKAPIFQVANVGVVADILEFMPELTEKLSDL
jgi:electron transfer flavoprotein alpha subunit